MTNDSRSSTGPTTTANPQAAPGATTVANPNSRNGLGLIGFGAAACVACCAGPIVGALGAVGAATVTAVALFGAAGLVVAALGGVWLWRRHTARHRSDPESVPVAGPIIKR